MRRGGRRERCYCPREEGADPCRGRLFRAGKDEGGDGTHHELGERRHLAKMWDGALCQVVYVGSADDPSSIVRQKFHHCCGYARVSVISAHDGDIEVFNDKYEAMMD